MKQEQEREQLGEREREQTGKQNDENWTNMTFLCFFLFLFLLLLLLLLLLWPQSALESQLGAAFRNPLGHMVTAPTGQWDRGCSPSV